MTAPIANGVAAVLVSRTAWGHWCICTDVDPGEEAGLFALGSLLPAKIGACRVEERTVGLFWRKSVRLGPVRLTGSRRGLGTSIGAGPLRVGRSRGRSRVSVRLPGGFRWRGRL